MKKYWKNIAYSGVLALSLTTLIVATQSGTAQEVHEDTSISPKQETIAKSFAIEQKESYMLIHEQKQIAMRNIERGSTEEKRLERKPLKIGHMEVKSSPQPVKKPEAISKSQTEPPSAPQPTNQAQPQPKPQPKPQPASQPKAQAQVQTQKAPAPQPVKKAVAPPVKATQNDSFYIKSIAMPYEHQKYLYEMTKKRGLDYLETLAFIGHESEFNPNAKGANNYGYFQISSVNHTHLSGKLGTKNAPFDPYVNINWGTYMISDLYKKYGNKDAVLSAYNKGEGGYAKTGKATAYIQKHNQVLAKLKSMK